jgi:hypothetical protein
MKKPKKTAKKVSKKTKKATKKTTKVVKKSAKKAVKKTAKKVVKKKTAKTKVSSKPVTKSNYTHVIAILDRSGSMSGVRDAAIGGFNEFLKKQKELKEKATMSVILFDDEYTPLYNGKEIAINDVQDLNEQTFVPRGMTALYDAIGKTIKSYNAKLQTLKDSEKPDKVLCIIVTDGHENASREFTTAYAIRTLISDMKTKDWEFIFLCSTEDTLTTGVNLGVSAGNTFKFATGAAAAAGVYSKISSATSKFRGMSKFDANYSATTNSLLEDDNKEEDKNKQ